MMSLLYVKILQGERATKGFGERRHKRARARDTITISLRYYAILR